MANYPVSLDTITNPTSGNTLDNPSHSLQHSDANDILEALEQKVGIGSSVAGSATSGHALVASTGGTTSWTTIGTAGISSGTATSGQVLTANGSGGVSFGNGGLTLINTTSFSAVSSQSFNNVFSSTYTNYRVLFHATGASSNSAITMRMRASGTDASGSNYYRAGTFNYNNSATVSALNASSTSFALVDILAAAPNRTYLTIELSQPNNATETMCLFMSAAQNSTSSYAFQGIGLQDLTTAYDGFTLLFSATSSGVVSIYGYNK